MGAREFVVSLGETLGVAFDYCYERLSVCPYICLKFWEAYKDYSGFLTIQSPSVT